MDGERIHNLTLRSQVWICFTRGRSIKTTSHILLRTMTRRLIYNVGYPCRHSVLSLILNFLTVGYCRQQQGYFGLSFAQVSLSEMLDECSLFRSCFFLADISRYSL